MSNCSVHFAIVSFILTSFPALVLAGMFGYNNTRRAIVIFVVFLAICIAIGYQYGSTIESDRSVITNIYSIGDHFGVYGSFVLGSGNIQTEPSFIFYKDSGDGGYVLDHVYAQSTTVYEDAETPYIKEIIDNCGGCCLKYEIHVPEGTIVRQFNLDGE